MVIQKKVSFIIALLILHLAEFAQAENENRTDEYGGEALGFLLERSAYVKTSDYPYEYEERNYFFDRNTDEYDRCKYLALETNLSFLLYETVEYLGYEFGLKATLLPVLGVKADVFMLQNSYSDSYDFVGNGKAGIFIPLAKHDYFNFSFGAYWSFFVDYGYTNGCAVDASLKVFPVKPVSLEFNFVEHCFDQSCNFKDDLYSEFSVKAGAMIKAIEFYGQWRYFRGNMWGVGLKRYF